MAMHSWPGGLSFFAGTAVGDVFTSDQGGKAWTTLATELPPISKARHYRHFLSADDKARIEGEARAEGRTAGVAWRMAHDAPWEHYHDVGEDRRP